MLLKVVKFSLFMFDYDGDATTSAGMSNEMKTFYSKQLLKDAEPELVHEQFCEKYPIPQGNGKTIEMRKFLSLPKATVPLTEGVTPSPSHLNVVAITATVRQFGTYVRSTDILRMTAIDPIIVETNTALASNAARTIDSLTRDEMLAGTNVFYGGTRTSRAAITATDVLTVNMVLDIVAELRANNAPTFDGSYVAIAHPYVLRDIMKTSDWKDAHKYEDSKAIFHGEIGEYGGVRFVSSSEAKVWAPDEISDGIGRLTCKTAIQSSSTTVNVDETLTAATPTTAIPVYIDGVANTITKIERINGSDTGSKLTIGTAITSLAVGDMVCGKGAGADGSAVFGVVFLGKGAVGKTELAGGGIKSIVKPLGSGEDPLDQRGTIGWKATHVAKRLNELYMVRAEVGSASSATAVAN